MQKTEDELADAAAWQYRGSGQGLIRRQVSLSLPLAMVNRLDQLADQQQRSRNWLVERIIGNTLWPTRKE